MKLVCHCLLLAVLLTPVSPSFRAEAQEAAPPGGKSLRTAFLLSLAVPGLGHRYANGGWTTGASLFTLADAGLWLALFGTTWQHGQAVQSYETLAATGAGAFVEGKDRRFFLNLATYRSSDDYLEAQLRNRAWDQLAYVSERAYQWAWQTEDDFQKFRDLREDAEALNRRRPILLTMLVANRLLAALTSIGAVQRANSPPSNLRFSMGPPPPASTLPQLHLQLRW